MFYWQHEVMATCCIPLHGALQQQIGLLQVSAHDSPETVMLDQVSLYVCTFPTLLSTFTGRRHNHALSELE